MAPTLVRAVLVLLLLSFLLPVSTGWAVQGQFVIPLKDKSGRQTGSFTYNESHALIVGVSTYTNGWPRLPGVKKDVKEVRQALQKHGFHVVVVEDPSQAELEYAYKDFILQYGLKPDNRLLFYFAGHGYTIKPAYASNDPVEWMGVIVSRDAPLPTENPESFRSHALSIERFASMAREIEAKHVLFLFDSCFSGARSFALSVASPADLTSIITQRTAESVRQFISSGTADQRVPDTSEFRRQFVMAVDGEADRNGDGHVTGSELGVFLQEKVTSYTRGTQTPQYGKILDPDLDKGDFVFPASSTLPPPLIISPPAELRATLVNSVGMEFVLIPAAEFTMGADDSLSLRPSHKVTISQPFYLGKYEVTQAQWSAVMGKNPSRFTGDPYLPVENVSWNEIQEFIRQLNTREGGTRYRLPTEAEWEHAARASAMTIYTFGDDAAQLGQYAWYDENADERTHAVGQLKPNTWGLYDTLGNVWEWCQDWYGDYPQRAAVDPQGTPQGAFRVYRGCGWHRGASTLYCQVASRHGARPSFRHPALGFRLLLMVRPEKAL